MRLVFMGTPEFARACLEKLHSDGFDIAAVYTKIDTPKNRGMKLIRRPSRNMPSLWACRCISRSPSGTRRQCSGCRELKPDLLVVVAYGKKFCRRLCWISRNTARSICTAASCRSFAAPAPVQRSILNHCDEAGVTAMYLSAGMDEGRYH